MLWSWFHYRNDIRLHCIFTVKRTMILNIHKMRVGTNVLKAINICLKNHQKQVLKILNTKALDFLKPCCKKPTRDYNVSYCMFNQLFN